MFFNKKAKECAKKGKKSEATRFLKKMKNLEKMVKKKNLTVNLLDKQLNQLENFNDDNSITNIVKETNKVFEDFKEQNEEMMDVLQEAADLNSELDNMNDEQINILEQIDNTDKDELDDELNDLMNEDKEMNLDSLDKPNTNTNVKEEEDDVFNDLIS